MAGLASVRQDDWGAGIFRGRRAPRGSVYDAVNALVSDEREIFKRGGTAYSSGFDSSFPYQGMAQLDVSAGARTLLWGTGVGLWTLAADGLSQAQLKASADFVRWARPARLGAMAALPLDAPNLSWAALYAGSRKTADYGAGTVTIAEGSKTLVGTGTSWLANVDAGMIVTVQDTEMHEGIVASVDSDTQITLRDPWGWSGSTARVYLAHTVVVLSPAITPSARSVALAAVGTPARLIMAVDNRVFFSLPGQPASLDDVAATNYHELPSAAIALGAEGIGNTCVIFTSDGVWAISNMDFDPLDDAGNQQHTVAQINKDIILWGDPGLAAWAGVLVVPAVDDVFLLGLDGAPVALSAAIRPLYRSYVKAGCKPGTAAVHRGHYFLPVVDASNTVIDVLVCRLDLRDRDGMRSAWTRWAGHAAGGAYAVRVGVAPRQPKLLATTGLRVTDISDCFNVPGVGTDADGTTPTFTVDTQDYPVGNGMRDAFVDRVRVEYEMAGAGSPAVTAGWASGVEGAAFTTVPAVRGGGVSDGSDYSAWRIGKTRDRIRFRIQSTSAVTKMILRRLEVLVRPNGRQ